MKKARFINQINQIRKKKLMQRGASSSFGPSSQSPEQLAWQPWSFGLSRERWHVGEQRSWGPFGIGWFGESCGSCRGHVASPSSTGTWPCWRSSPACFGATACEWSRQCPSCRRTAQRRRSCCERGRWIGTNSCLSSCSIPKSTKINK